jgi:hypothetical protein
MTKISIQNYHQSIYLIVDKLSTINKLVIDDQEKSMKTRFHRQLLIDNRLKKLNTATLMQQKITYNLFANS